MRTGRSYWRTGCLAVLLSAGCPEPEPEDTSVDADRDGYLDSEDCDDADAAVNPGAAETCDAVDNDCDGLVDDADDSLDTSTAETWYADADADGFGDPASSTPSCEQPEGHVGDATDCDDAAAAIHPGASEVCDGADNDCDGLVDDADDGLDTTTAATWHADADTDGFGDPDTSVLACEQPDGFLDDATDCSDGDAATYPGAAEICGDGVVNDCDGGEADARAQCSLSGDISLGSADARFVDGSAEDAAGSAVAGAGDVNGDGFADMLVGAPGPLLGSSAGAAYLVLGSAAPGGDRDLSTADLKLVGESDTAAAGSALSGAGDVDGDGLDDILVVGSGSAYLVLGTASPSGTRDLSSADAEISGAGLAVYSVSGAGDVDGDGFDDLLLGGPGPTRLGAAYVVLGSSSPSGDRDLSTAELELVGEHEGDFAGWAVSGAGDVDGDGLADVLVGTYAESSVGAFAGAAYLVLGSESPSGTRSLSDADAKLTGESEQDVAGAAVSGAGDVDGDGLADFIIGAYWQGLPYPSDHAGAAYLVLGSADPSGIVDLADADAKLVGVYNEEQAGRGVAGAGDIDGDGLDDLVVGASDRTVGRWWKCGVAYLVYGSESVMGSIDLSTADAMFYAEEYLSHAGFAVAGAGDVDSDGLDDLLVGTRWNAGAAYLILGGGH